MKHIALTLTVLLVAGSACAQSGPSAAKDDGLLDALKKAGETVQVAKTAVRPSPASLKVTCDSMYLADMNDTGTLSREGSAEIPMADPQRASVRKAFRGFQVTAAAAPLIQDANTFERGFEVTIQINKNGSAAYASSAANPQEPFRRISAILGYGKEQVTVNCFIEGQGR